MSISIDPLNWKQDHFPDEAYPKLSLIIPTFNSALLLPRTLESIFDQEYPDYEIVIVDAGSTDRTIEMVKSYGSERIRIYSVSIFHPFEMLNKGISLANGEYLNFLKPGDYFLSPKGFKCMMNLALSNQNPELVYAASLLRERWSEVTLRYAPLDMEYLNYGEAPTYLESCFFEKSLFQKIGKFDPRYELRSDFDLFCRFFKEKDLRFNSTSRVLLDYEEAPTNRKEIWEHFKETWKILYRNFGFKSALLWLMCQDDLDHFIKVSLKDVKKAFVRV